MRYFVFILLFLFIAICGTLGYVLFSRGFEEPMPMPREPEPELLEDTIPDYNSREVLSQMFAAGDASYTSEEYGTVVAMQSDDTTRTITVNGIPDHTTEFSGEVETRNLVLKMPINPKRSNATSSVAGFYIGVAINGVLFDATPEKFWENDILSGLSYDTFASEAGIHLDAQTGHVSDDGLYHYHGLPDALTGEQTKDKHASLVGFAADGFPIYARFGFADPTGQDEKVIELSSSYQIHSGERVTSEAGKPDGTFVEDYEFVPRGSDLDACNGRYTVAPEFPDGTYAYFITQDYPRLPACFAGKPDPSFARNE